MKKLYASICLLIVVAGVVTGAYFFLRPEESRFGNVEVLAIIADGFDYGELYGVNSTLAEEGVTMTTASFTTDDISGHRSYPRNYEPDISFDEVSVSQYDAIFIPGGNGPENIINHPEGQKVFDILIQAYNEGKIIAAICHGPWVLAAANIVDGMSVTCYNDAAMVSDLIDSGANVDTSQMVVRDGNLITANGPRALNAFTEEIVSLLVEKQD